MQRIILAESTSDSLIILPEPPPSIQIFLNVKNATAPQADCVLTYAGHKIYPQTSFCQALLQRRILAIPETDDPTGLSPLLNPQLLAGSENAQLCAMRLQVLLAMGQDRISKEESRYIMDQRVHGITTTQELCYSKRKFFRLEGDYLGTDGPLSQEMVTQTLHIYRFEGHYTTGT